MTRPHAPLRRLLKWIGLVLCILLAGTWAAVLFKTPPEKRLEWLFVSLSWLLVTAPITVTTAALWWYDHQPPPGYCEECGCDLTGNVSGICPECGEYVVPQ